MRPLFEFHNLPIVFAVLWFVVFLIALLVIVDHKSRLPSEEKPNLFSIAGKRGNHPIWAWLTSALLLWATIGLLLISTGYSMVKAWTKPVEGPKILTKLDEERNAEKLRHFHNLPEKDFALMGKKPVCFYCHGDFPHAKKPMVRSLLNMHTQFVGCFTCHFNETKVPENSVVLRWLNYSEIPTTGKPFGTDVDPVTGDLIKTDDYFSKIVPYQIVDGKEKLLEIPETSLEAKEFLSLRNKMSEQDKDAVKKTFHAQLNPVGRFCTRCHAPEKESFIPLRELGFSEKRISAVTNLNIVGIVQKYREFYLPMIFNKGFSVEKREALLGHAAADQKITEEMKDDPRTWWRNSFAPPQPQEDADVKNPSTSSRK